MTGEGEPMDTVSARSGHRGQRLLTDGGTATADTGLLPPADARPAQILGVSGPTVQEFHVDTVAALIDNTDPDVVIAAPPDAGSVAPALRQQIDVPVIRPGRSVNPDVIAVGNGVIVVVTPSENQSLGAEEAAARVPDEETADRGDDAASDTSIHRCLVTDALSLTVDPYDRTARVEGVKAYCERLPTAWSADDLTHLSTGLRPGFSTSLEWASEGPGSTIVGIGDSDADLGVGSDVTETSAAFVEVYPNGAAMTESLDPGRFGLRSVLQVGTKRAETLRRAGIATPEDVAAADVTRIADLAGIGRESASTIHTAARAAAEEQVVPTGDDALPYGDPVFVDVETDGRNPSTAWLIGVLDGDAESGNYLAFREQQPGDGAHLDAFMTWLTGSAAGRPVVAWHGNGFDFPVIADQLRQRCPEHLGAWEDTYQFDALYWARDKNGGNAALPGRTDRLEDVARALGWEPSTTGIGGGIVAEVYVDWRARFQRAADPSTVTEPPWNRLESYCEDDVRALATIYDALRAAAKRDPDSSTPTGADTTQGALGDFT